jgi:hypothetical protein
VISAGVQVQGDAASESGGERGRFEVGDTWSSPSGEKSMARGCNGEMVRGESAGEIGLRDGVEGVASWTVSDAESLDGLTKAILISAGT